MGERLADVCVWGGGGQRGRMRHEGRMNGTETGRWGERGTERENET